MTIWDKEKIPSKPEEAAAARPRLASLAADAGSSGSDLAALSAVLACELSPEGRAALNELTAEIEKLRRELDTARSRVGYLERLADQDSLLPLVNRRAFVRELSRTMSYARRYRVPCSVLYFDLNDLKAINDNFGHAAGDAALVRVAETLIASVREFDIVGRLGGDEFGVILVHIDEKGAGEKAAALAAAVAAKPLVYRDSEIPLSVAYGSYEFRPDENVEHAIDMADERMYARKKAEPGA